ncbi:MAG: hypothetical protein AAB938_00845 [Patescibacteria group bacterium]
MGQMEQKSKQRTRVKNLQGIILDTVAAAGVISIALLAPNTLTALKKFGMLPGPRQKETISITRKRLVKAGLLAYDDRGLLRLTARGEKKLHYARMRDFKLKKPRRWDRKWRVLIFDIREKKRSTRDKVRYTLSAIGFVRLQDSVWVYPYPCDDFITLLKADFSLGRELLYLIVDSIEFDRDLRKQFGLKES